MTVIVFCFGTCYSWPSEDAFPGSWYPPGECCQLKWQYISLGELLPRDYVLAGVWKSQKFAFTRSGSSDTAVKSERATQVPNWLGTKAPMTTRCPILTNPRNCSIGWYRKGGYTSRVPAIDGWMFATLGKSTYGDFVRYDMMPGRTLDYDGSLMAMTSESESRISIQPNNLELLYVDCIKSMSTSASSKL